MHCGIATKLAHCLSGTHMFLSLMYGTDVIGCRQASCSAWSFPEQQCRHGRCCNGSITRTARARVILVEHDSMIVGMSCSSEHCMRLKVMILFPTNVLVYCVNCVLKRQLLVLSPTVGHHSDAYFQADSYLRIERKHLPHSNGASVVVYPQCNEFYNLFPINLEH